MPGRERPVAQPVVVLRPAVAAGGLVERDERVPFRRMPAWAWASLLRAPTVAVGVGVAPGAVVGVGVDVPAPVGASAVAVG